MATEPVPDSASHGQALFADFLARREAGEQVDFDALCLDHPSDADALRKLFDEWDRVPVVARSAGGKGEFFAAHLKQKYGEGMDPTVQLREGSAGSAGSATDELVHRLSRHAPMTSRYKLEGEVARGGMGAILKVWDEDLRRHLAMKVVLGKGEPASTGVTPPVDANQLARFLEEAQVTGQLDHPGIVPVHELGLDADGRVYFTMKLVKGRDLKRIFDLVFEEKERWNETRALGVILKVCEAMAYAHVKGVIHRDLKPANVMVGNFGEVYVMDWGLARVLGKKDTHDIRMRPDFSISIKSVKTERRKEREETPDSPIITMDGDVMGTPAYMPPEQARGEVERLSPRSDVYAIGAMLYHLLARQAPYVPRGARLSQRTLLGLVVQGPPTALSTLRKDVPAELVAICERAMARDAPARYADTLALAEDLRAYLEHRVVGAYETGTWAETKKWVQRNRPLASAVAGAALILVAGIAISTAFGKRANAKAAEAEMARNELKEKNTALEETNTALARAKTEADTSAAAARASAVEATRQKNDVLSLSAIQELKELVEQADTLWPALPETLPEYDRWLVRAVTLIDGQAADPAGRIAAHPSLKDHEAKLAELRQRAKPYTPEQMEGDRRSKPRFAEWEKARAMVTWMRRMLGEAPWPSEDEVESALAKETLPTDAASLDALIWPLVDTEPSRIVYGSEIKALVLARRAAAHAEESERANSRDTLAWALYRCNQFDEALAEEQLAVDEAEGEQKVALLASLKNLREHVERWTNVETRAKRVESAGRVSAFVSDLAQSINERSTFEFEDAQDRWWHAQLSQLVAELQGFTGEKVGGLFTSGVSEAHGWGVSKRVEFARTVGERTIDGPQPRKLWYAAIAAIAGNPKYGGLKLTPQVGLLPIGEDPASHLWEFAHLQTGDPAERGVDGKLILTDETGLVFVLIPGGSFWMGAQKTDPSGRNFDPQALENESPVKELTLGAYFLSKYEMTQGQWKRFVGRNPSFYEAGSELGGRTCSELNPVEQVSWNECTAVLMRLGLVLPTEAQWEYGARAGTESAWWTGEAKENLSGAANLADAFCRSNGGPDGWVYDDWLDDGWTTHAPVGSYRANAFGLHDVLGNVWELCRDDYGRYLLPTQSGDGERKVVGANSHVRRGAAFSKVASTARSAVRITAAPSAQEVGTGLRPARAISTH